MVQDRVTVTMAGQAYIAHFINEWLLSIIKQLTTSLRTIDGLTHMYDLQQTVVISISKVLTTTTNTKN